jgi:hypothetical protein
MQMSAHPSTDEPIAWHKQEVLLIREVGRLLGRSVEPHFVIRQTLRLLSEWLGLNRGRVLMWDETEEVLSILKDKDTRFSTTPDKVMNFADFMALAGSIKTKPKDWKELFIPQLHSRSGS